MPGQTSPWNLRYPLYTEAVAAATQIQNLANDIDDAFTTVQASIASAANKIRCRVSRVTAQSIPNNAFTNTTFTAEQFDNDNMANLGVDATRLIVNTAGLYLVIWQARFDANSTGERAARATTTALPLNGALRSQTVASPDQTHLAGQILVHCAVGQEIRLSVFQNSGGALNLNTGFLSATRMTG